MARETGFHSAYERTYTLPSSLSRRRRSPEWRWRAAAWLCARSRNQVVRTIDAECYGKSQFFSNCLLAFFLLHGDLEAGGHIAMQADRHIVFAQALQRLVELDLAAVDVKAFLGQGIREVRRTDRTEKGVLLADFARELERNIIELFGQLLGCGLFAGRFAGR